MDLVGADAHTNGLTGGAGAGGVDQPLTALALNVQLKVNALEDDIIDHAHQLTLHGADHFNVLGADHHLYALFPGKASVHAGELHTEKETRKSRSITPSTMLESPIKSATKAFLGSL